MLFCGRNTGPRRNRWQVSLSLWRIQFFEPRSLIIFKKKTVFSTYLLWKSESHLGPIRLLVQTQLMSSNLKCHLGHGHVIVDSIKGALCLGRVIQSRKSSNQRRSINKEMAVYIVIVYNLIHWDRWALDVNPPFHRSCFQFSSVYRHFSNKIFLVGVSVYSPMAFPNLTMRQVVLGYIVLESWHKP